MYYTAQFVDPGAGQEKFTRILLYNTPVVAPEVLGLGVHMQGAAFDPSFTRQLVMSRAGKVTTGN